MQCINAHSRLYAHSYTTDPGSLRKKHSQFQGTDQLTCIYSMQIFKGMGLLSPLCTFTHMRMGFLRRTKAQFSKSIKHNFKIHKTEVGSVITNRKHSYLLWRSMVQSPVDRILHPRAENSSAKATISHRRVPWNRWTAPVGLWQQELWSLGMFPISLSPVQGNLPCWISACQTTVHGNTRAQSA